MGETPGKAHSSTDPGKSVGICFLSFSAYLGRLGVLGERLFLGSGSANSNCAKTTMKELIAEDAEATEVRRERRRLFSVTVLWARRRIDHSA
jgi:hypothetical protein